MSYAWLRIFSASLALATVSAVPGLAQTTYEFDLVRARFTVVGFLGTEYEVEASGPATVQVTFETTEGAADDDDMNMLDEVIVEMVSLSLIGFNEALGEAPLGLWGGAQSLGQIEEVTNTTSGTLDLAPFAPSGSAESYFDLHLETTVAGITVHNADPARVEAVISEWPPPAGELFVGSFSPDIPFRDSGGFQWASLRYAEIELVPTGDWGDAPDPLDATPGEYPTLKASNGAAHDGDGTLRLGSLWDRELDGQPTADASGEGADDDGVVFTSTLETGILPTQTSVEITASQTGQLDAWLDFNLDGDWADAGEQIFTDTALASGNNALMFTVPVGAAPGCSYGRFRLSTAGGLSFDGIAEDGEVEDYQVGIFPVADLDIFNQSLAGMQTFVAGNSITVAGDLTPFPSVTVLDGAQIVFHAENQVVLKNGLVVEENGNLTIRLGSTPGGCPPS